MTRQFNGNIICLVNVHFRVCALLKMLVMTIGNNDGHVVQ